MPHDESYVGIYFSIQYLTSGGVKNCLWRCKPFWVVWL